MINKTDIAAMAEKAGVTPDEGGTSNGYRARAHQYKR